MPVAKASGGPSHRPLALTRSRVRVVRAVCAFGRLGPTHEPIQQVVGLLGDIAAQALEQ